MTAELRKLLAEATPGPWKIVGGRTFYSDNYSGKTHLSHVTVTNEADAALIVYLRNHAEDIAALIETLEMVDGYVGQEVSNAIRAALAPFAPVKP